MVVSHSLDKCIKIALQGLAFWIGHGRSLYRDHSLSEGAITGELCNLIFANRPADWRIACEVQYKELAPDHFRGQHRADLVVYKLGDYDTSITEEKIKAKNKLPPNAIPQCIFEVKRSRP